MDVMISVIIPIFNSEAFLARCLESVLGQTLQSFEVICVSDGANERCQEILGFYQKRDARIKIINQQKQGTAISRNNGLALATGEYIYYLDSDDVIHPQLLEYTLFIAQKHEAELVSFDWMVVLPAETPRFEPLKSFDCYPISVPAKPLHHLKKRSAFRIGFNAWSKLYSRSLAEKVSFISGNTVEDLPHTVCVLRDNPKTVIAKACLYYYTVRPDSASGAPCTPQKIDNYHEGLLFIYQYYNCIPDLRCRKETLKWIRRHLFLNVLKHQVKQIDQLPALSRAPVLEKFRSELRDLKGKKLLCWHDCTVRYFFSYYLRHRWILSGQP